MKEKTPVKAGACKEENQGKGPWKRVKIRRTATLMLLVLFFFLSGCAGASDTMEMPEPGEAVKVQIADFPIYFNQVKIENATRMYPVLIYEGIPYFPMTYYDCRLMGLETISTAKEGFRVAKAAVNWDLKDKYQSEQKNQMEETAWRAQVPVEINGQTLEESQLGAPVLFCRGILYFPLIADYLQQAFGWTCSFQQEEGLRLSTIRQGAGAGEVDLAIGENEDGSKGAFLVTEGTFYYQGQDNVIYETGVGRAAERIPRYDLGKNPDGSLTEAELYQEDERVILSYLIREQGGFSRARIWLKEDGSNQALGYFERDYSRLFSGFEAIIDQSLPLEAGNLYILQGESPQDPRPVGEQGILYGWACQQDPSGGVSGTESRRMYLLGEELYLLGAEKTKSGILDSGVYRVNIRTGRTQRVTEGGAMDFLMEGESLLYRDQRGYIYRIDEVNGENACPERLTQDRASDFVALNDTVYYINVDQEGQLYGTGREEPYNPGGVVKELSVSQGYLIAVFEDGLGGEYKLMILDGEGQAVYQTIEEVLTAAIDQGKIIFLK